MLLPMARVRHPCGGQVGPIGQARIPAIRIAIDDDISQRRIKDVGVLLGGAIAQAHIVKRSEEHTSELQSLMRISYAVFCLNKKNNTTPDPSPTITQATPTTTQYENNHNQTQATHQPL